MIDRLRAKIAAQSLAHVEASAGELAAVELGAPFDLVVCSSVLAFVPDYAATVARLAAALKPGGLLVHWDWALDPTADEPFGLTPAQIEAGLGAAGLQAVEVRTAFELPFGEHVMRPLVGVGRAPR